MERAESAHDRVRETLAEMRALVLRELGAKRDRYEELSDQIETQTMAYMVPGVSVRWQGYKLTGKETALADFLFRQMRTGFCVTREAMLAALYFDRPNNEPEIKILDIFVCKLRRKLREKNCPYIIETIWGRGYRMVEGEDTGTIPLYGRTG